MSETYILITSNEGDVGVECLTKQELEERINECPQSFQAEDCMNEAVLLGEGQYDLGGNCEGWLVIKGEVVPLKKEKKVIDVLVPGV